MAGPPAAKDATWERLRPTVETLQDSALDLFYAMVNPAGR